MQIHFYKYQGTGNDFIMIDDRTATFPIKREQIARLCNRRFGIGADGLILLQNQPGYDFKMVYFNADGGESSMCGNGGRCIVQFAYHLGIFKEEANFLAVDGPHQAYIRDNLIYLKMIDVQEVEHGTNFNFLNTGSPHYVTFTEDASTLDVVSYGKSIRYNDRFAPAGGTNVNFVELKPDNTLFVRTYERGVEDETFSCGTGVTACAIAASYKQLQSPVKIQTIGGPLQVSFTKLNDQTFSDIYLIGPAERVFTGEVFV